MNTQESKMFWADLDVFRDLGFPQTAARIREELKKHWNSDFIIGWAFDNGYKVFKVPDNPHCTDEFNFYNKWVVERMEVPYCCNANHRSWYGATAKEAIDNAVEAILKWKTDPEGRYVDGKKYKLEIPKWWEQVDRPTK